MSEVFDIVLNVTTAIKKAEELEKLASQLETISNTELDEILTNISSSWKGDNAVEFIKKGARLSDKIADSAKQLRKIASVIRTIAKNLQEADSQAAATAKEI